MLDPFFGAHERDIFLEIAVKPWTQFAGDNFLRNMLTAIAFVPGSLETICREINSGARFTKDISHGIQIRWKFNFALT